MIFIFAELNLRLTHFDDVFYNSFEQLVAYTFVVVDEYFHWL